MNEVNFLPASYFQRHSRRRRVTLEFLLVLIVAAGLGGWFHATRASNESLHRQLADLESAEATDVGQPGEMAQLQARYKELSKLTKVRGEVALPLSFSQVLAAIAQATPESVAMTELAINCPRPTPAPPMSEEEKKKKKASERKPAPPAAAAPMTIELSGISPSDDRIADLVGRLSAHPMFARVKLEFSRAGEVEHLIVRQFRITMQVPLDRDYRPASSPKEVAGAH